MGITHIVGRQRKPDSLFFRHAFRHFAHHILQVTRAAANALLRIETVAQPQALRRVAGEHHQAAHPGRRGGLRVPVGFLIGNCRQQFPVDIGGVFFK